MRNFNNLGAIAGLVTIAAMSSALGLDEVRHNTTPEETESYRKEREARIQQAKADRIERRAKEEAAAQIHKAEAIAKRERKRAKALAIKNRRE